MASFFFVAERTIPKGFILWDKDVGGCFIMLFDPAATISDGFVHDRKRMLPAGLFFAFLKTLIMCFDLFKLVGLIKMLTRNPSDSLFAIEVAYRF